jgi:hypothetical protein
MQESLTYRHPMLMNTNIDMMFVQMLIVQYKVGVLFVIENNNSCAILFTWKKECTHVCMRYNMDERKIVSGLLTCPVNPGKILEHNLEQGIFSYDLYENIEKTVEILTKPISI